MGFRGLTINTPATDEAHILAEDDAAIYQSVFGGDCVFDIGSKMKATVLSNNKIRIGDGVVCAGGHVGRNNYGDYEDLAIENGTSGMKRNDFIMAKFTSTGPGGVDTFSLEVKKGTAGITASDPVVTKGNLYEGASLREFPLYRVKIEGLSITAVEQLFTVRKTNEQLQNEVIELNSKLDCGIIDAFIGINTTTDLEIVFNHEFESIPCVVASFASPTPTVFFGRMSIMVKSVSLTKAIVTISNYTDVRGECKIHWMAMSA